MRINERAINFIISFIILFSQDVRKGEVIIKLLKIKKFVTMAFIT